MSIDCPSDGEIEAYDRGFANAEDYWRPLEQERIIKLLMNRAFWLVHLDKLAEAEELKLQAALIKGENNSHRPVSVNGLS
jgi:hypothetical protein